MSRVLLCPWECGRLVVEARTLVSTLDLTSVARSLVDARVYFEEAALRSPRFRNTSCVRSSLPSPPPKVPSVAGCTTDAAQVAQSIRVPLPSFVGLPPSLLETVRRPSSGRFAPNASLVRQRTADHWPRISVVAEAFKVMQRQDNTDVNETGCLFIRSAGC